MRRTWRYAVPAADQINAANFNDLEMRGGSRRIILGTGRNTSWKARR